MHNIFSQVVTSSVEIRDVHTSIGSQVEFNCSRPSMIVRSDSCYGRVRAERDQLIDQVAPSALQPISLKRTRILDFPDGLAVSGCSDRI